MVPKKAIKSGSIQPYRRFKHAELYNAVFGQPHQAGSASLTPNSDSNDVRIVFNNCCDSSTYHSSTDKCSTACLSQSTGGKKQY